MASDKVPVLSKNVDENLPSTGRKSCTTVKKLSMFRYPAIYKTVNFLFT